MLERLRFDSVWSFLLGSSELPFLLINSRTERNRPPPLTAIFFSPCFAVILRPVTDAYPIQRMTPGASTVGTLKIVRPPVWTHAAVEKSSGSPVTEGKGSSGPNSTLDRPSLLVGLEYHDASCAEYANSLCRWAILCHCSLPTPIINYSSTFLDHDPLNWSCFGWPVLCGTLPQRVFIQGTPKCRQLWPGTTHWQRLLRQSLPRNP